MANTSNKKSSVTASAAKPSGKPPPRDKTLGIDPDIRFYNLEDSDETAGGEEAEILVIHDSKIAVSKQNLVNSKFPYIYTFDHERPAVVNAMCGLNSGLFKHPDITSHMDMDKSVAYTQRILRGAGI